MMTLSGDRVRRATQIARDLTLDLQAMEIDFQTEGLQELFHAVEELRERLLPMFREKSNPHKCENPRLIQSLARKLGKRRARLFKSVAKIHNLLT
jgi:hypothetical protein